MSGFSSISGPKQPVHILTALLRKQTIPHALLFTGSDGAGKQETALAFSQALNCIHQRHGLDKDPSETAFPENVPCGACKPCRKIASGNHPDLIRVAPMGPRIKIAQIRELGQTLSMRPYEAQWRAVIISGADTMNAAASNALLKMLEEPPARTVLLLCAAGRSDLLPTIVSRCQHIRFRPIDIEALACLLAEQRGTAPLQARIIASMAGGSHQRALDMADGNWFALRTWLLDEMAAIAQSPRGRLMALAETLSQNREILDTALEVMQSWFRDVAIYRYAPRNIIHRDFDETIRRASRTGGTPSELSKMRSIHTLQRTLLTNANGRLALESLLLKLADPCCKEST